MSGFKWLLAFAACGVIFTQPLSKFQESYAQEFLPLTSDFQKTESDRNSSLPRNFRTSSDEIQVEHHAQSLRGLKELNIAGTSQFNEQQLHAILSYLEAPILVVDLRAETHLIFEDLSGNQIPISAYASQNAGNEGKQVDEIASELSRYKAYINTQELITLHYTNDSEVIYENEDPKFPVGEVYTEEEVVANLRNIFNANVEYVLLPVTDHKNPNDQIADEFLKIFREVKNRNDNTTILLHCKAGRGRTGLLMNMADMMQNAALYDLSLEEIVHRQFLLGSPDYLKVKEGREENSEERNSFLKKFYNFVKAKDGYHAGSSFSEWSARHQ